MTTATRTLLAASSAILILSGAAFGRDKQSFDQIGHGRYLTTLSDCAGCHTAPGGAPFAGGLPLQTPFGTLVAPNITPDTETGIGNWSDDDFVAAIRDGRGHNGVRLYPAMPYPAYTKMTRDDVLAIRAYLATVPPVRHNVVANQLPFPFNIRLVMLAWNWVNFTPGRYMPDPGKSAEWNRGAYIVQGPGHCGTCHTPKNLLGGDKSDQPLQGAVLQGWFAPNITADQHKGIGQWSKDDLAQYLKTGTNKWTLASGPMAEAVTHSTSQMTDADVTAIAAYLLDSGAGQSTKPAPVAADDPVMKAGAAIYKDACSACHKGDGSGESQLFPRLAGSSLVQSDDPTTLVRMVLHGSYAVATPAAPTGPGMPAFDWRLNDAQAAAVVTYIRNSWGNAAPPVSADTVSRSRAQLAKSP
ncbi:MAG TPA: cytochrome c [Nitrobacter sp.]|nr:cytochrome c [Nitrobacter sp.]